MALLGHRIRSVPLADIFIATFVAVISAAIVDSFAGTVLDFFDMSAFMDAGYRVHLGQRPFVDFYFTSGPVHLYMHAVSYALLGVTLNAVRFHIAAVTVVGVVATYIVARIRLPKSLAWSSALLTGIALYGPVGHPWYDQNAAIWSLLAAAFMELAYRESDKCGNVLSFFCGAALALSTLTKINVGFPSVAIVLVSHALDPLSRRRAGWVAGGFLALLVLVFGTRESIVGYVYQTLVAAGTGGRIFEFFRLAVTIWHLPVTILLGLSILAVVVGGASLETELRRDLFLLVGWSCTSVTFSWTSSFIQPANIGLLGLVAAYALRIGWRLLKATGPRRSRRMMAFILVSLGIAWSFYSAATATRLQLAWRWRMALNDPAAWNTGDYALQTPALKGWLCNRLIGEDFDAVVREVQTRVPISESLLVYPDATLLYAVTGRESWRGAPFLFHLGAAPPPGKCLDDFRSAFTASPPLWIVRHRARGVPWVNIDDLEPWLGIDEPVREDYVLEWISGDFELLRRRRDAP